MKDADGLLLATAIPAVPIVKDGSYSADAEHDDIESQVDLIALIRQALESSSLAGFVVEGLAPYGAMSSNARHRLMLSAVYSGLPVVRVGRGNAEGFPRLSPPFISGSNLTATKARLLLMASLMKLGSLPPARDPFGPTAEEAAATRLKVAQFQAIFDTH